MTIFWPQEHGNSFCCDDSELSDEASVSISGATQSYPTSMSDMSGDFFTRIDDTASLELGRKHAYRHGTTTRSDEHRTANGADLIRTKNSCLSSGSEFLVPLDSEDEVQTQGEEVGFVYIDIFKIFPVLIMLD